MEKKLEDYLHLYKKVPIGIFEEGAEPVGHYLEGLDWCVPKKEVIAERVGWDYKNIKPILRPINSITSEEWLEVASIILDTKEKAIMTVTIDDLRYAFLFDEEDIKDNKEIDVYELLEKAEKNDDEHTLCMSKHGNVSYGVDNVCLLPLYLQSKYINWLRAKFFDADGLIESGLALDETKLPLKNYF